MELMKKRCRSKAEAAEANQEFRYALRKFRNHRENFAILEKFSLCTNFARLEKITVHSENLNFTVPVFFRYDSEISLS